MTESLPPNPPPRDRPPLAGSTQPPGPPLVGPPPSFASTGTTGPTRRNHPAGTARKVAAGVSVAAFAALAGAIAVNATDSSGSTSPAPATGQATDTGSTTDDGADGSTQPGGLPPGGFEHGDRPDGQDGWSASPPSADSGTGGIPSAGPSTQSQGS